MPGSEPLKCRLSVRQAVVRPQSTVDPVPGCNGNRRTRPMDGGSGHYCPRKANCQVPPITSLVTLAPVVTGFITGALHLTGEQVNRTLRPSTTTSRSSSNRSPFFASIATSGPILCSTDRHHLREKKTASRPVRQRVPSVLRSPFTSAVAMTAKGRRNRRRSDPPATAPARR